MDSLKYLPPKVRGAGNRKKSTLKIVMTLLVRDEVDIILSFLKYHSKMGVDLILATDNGSIDGTTDVLKSFEGTGKIKIFHEPSRNYLQDIWVTEMARRAYSDYNADWVINGDADEFFIPRSGNIKDTLAQVNNTDILVVNRHDFVPIIRPEILAPPIEMTYRKKISLEWVSGKPITPKTIHRGFPDVIIGRGAHNVSSKYAKNISLLPKIETFHYPIRSFKQFKSKVDHVGSGRRKNKLSSSRYSCWYPLLQEGKLEDVYQEYLFDDKRIEQSLISGEIIEEHRLASILNISEKLKGS